MGLDITAVSEAKLCGQPLGEHDGHWKEGHVYAWVNEAFPDRNGAFKNGCYVVKDQFGFRAGSYSGYNYFREILSEAVLGVSPEVVWKEPAKYQDSAFYELINFADNEGILGTEVCCKLAGDFAANRLTFVEYVEVNVADSDYFITKYEEWTKAVDLACCNGFIQFH